MFFARAFARTIEVATKSERTKYPAVYNPAEPDDVIISARVVERISPTIRKYRSTEGLTALYPCSSGHEILGHQQSCTCPLNTEERSMSFWLRGPFEGGRHYRISDSNARGYDALEFAKTLLLHGQLDILLRVSSHHDVNLDRGWQLQPHSGGEMIGFAELVRSTLMSYICLNVFFLKPETYNDEFKVEYWKKKPHGPVTRASDADYRMTTSYQKMLSRCTGRRPVDVHTYPHRQFFGVASTMYHGSDWNRLNSGRNWACNPAVEGNLHGACGGEYMPVESDVPLIISYLRRKGLPTELALQILHLAVYVPQRKLPVAGDPFHEKNAVELRKYLTYCWKLLIWSGTLAEANGTKINWVYEVTSCIFELWGVDNPKMVSRSWGDSRDDDFLELQSTKHEFI